MKTTLSAEMVRMLRSLVSQEQIAKEYPNAYTAGATPGTMGCHKAVAEALLRRGLVSAHDYHPDRSGMVHDTPEYCHINNLFGIVYTRDRSIMSYNRRSMSRPHRKAPLMLDMGKIERSSKRRRK